jgi:nitrilase
VPSALTDVLAAGAAPVLHPPMRASVIQFEAGADKAANIAAASALIEAAVAADKHGLISLPEMWTCLGGDRAAKYAAGEVLPAPGEAGGQAYSFLQDTARRHGLIVHGGSIGELDAGTLFNTSLVFGPDGAELGRYRKIHLFDITTPSGEGYRESRLFGAGREVVVAEADGIRLGLSICYDLRFPELYLALRRRGAAVIFVPSAFTAETGRDHWDVLLRARAVETQSWIIAAATTGRHADAQGRPRETWGHSMIVDPWGTPRAALASGPGFATADIDLQQVERVRDAMPVLQHRRLA